MNIVSILLLLTLAILWSNASVSVHNPFYCYSEDPVRPQYNMFSLTTAYETQRRNQVDPTVSSCTPSKFWMLSRHGNRNPLVGDLTRILQNIEALHQGILRNYDAGRTSLCASDAVLLRNWSLNANLTLEFEA